MPAKNRRKGTISAGILCATTTLCLTVMLALPLAAMAIPVVATDTAATALRFDLDDTQQPPWVLSGSRTLAAYGAVSGDNRIDSLLSGTQLVLGPAQPVHKVTYSFYEDDVFHGAYYGSETGVREVSEGVKANVRAILAWYSSIIPVDFVEVAETATTVGQFRIMLSGGRGNPAFYAYCYLPYSDDPFSTSSDIHLNASYDNPADAVNGYQNAPGSHGYSTLVHELGHGLGLKHPFSGSPVLSNAEDNNANTVMSYDFTGREPGTPMAYDVAALQFMYGARQKNTGDDTYAFTSRGTSQYTLGSATWQSGPGQSKQTIWDSAGRDTLDASALPLVAEGYRFDLRGAGWLIGSAQEVNDAAGRHYFEYGSSLAFGFAPERIVNSASSDTIIANASANTFTGYTVGRSVGSDRIEGASSADRVELAGYAQGTVTATRGGNDLVVRLGDRGSVTVAGYYTGNAPTIAFTLAQPGQPVDVGFLTPPTTSGEVVQPVTGTTGAPYSAPAGGSAPSPVVATVAIAKPRATLTTPVAPSTMYRARYKTVYGYLKPRHTSGSTSVVRIYRYKKNSKGVYVKYDYVRARLSNYSTYSKYTKSLAFPSRGKWRIRAYAPADAKHAATWSSKYDYVTVK